MASRTPIARQQPAGLLVIGATGRVGTVLRSHWRDGSARWQSRQPVPGFVCFDPLAEPDAFARAAVGAHTILCLAGVVPGRAGPDGYAINVSLALATVRAACRVGARAVLASSASVYGCQNGALNECALLRPTSAYGRSKALMERAAGRMGKRLGVAVTSLRIGNIAGLDSCLGGWKPGFELDSFDDGGQPRRSYIGVGTLSRTLGALLACDDLPPIMNLAEPGCIDVGDLLTKAGYGWSPRRASRSAIPRVELDVSRLAARSAPDNRVADPERMVREWWGYRNMRCAP